MVNFGWSGWWGEWVALSKFQEKLLARTWSSGARSAWMWAPWSRASHHRAASQPAKVLRLLNIRFPCQRLRRLPLTKTSVPSKGAGGSCSQPAAEDLPIWASEWVCVWSLQLIEPEDSPPSLSPIRPGLASPRLESAQSALVNARLSLY